jgi:hypothetical protein
MTHRNSNAKLQRLGQFHFLNLIDHPQRGEIKIFSPAEQMIDLLPAF